MKRYSATVLIETDGDPKVLLRSLQDVMDVAVAAGALYRGPLGAIAFGPLMTEAEAH